MTFNTKTYITFTKEERTILFTAMHIFEKISSSEEAPQNARDCAFKLNEDIWDYYCNWSED